MSTAAPALFALVESFFTEYLPRQRAAIRSFFKHLVRNDLAHSQQYTQVLAIPSKKARQRPATYLEADDVRAVIAQPDRRTADGWRDYTLLLFLYNCGARVSEAADVYWNDLQLLPRVRYVYVARAKGNVYCRCGQKQPAPCTACAACQRRATISMSF
jgi:site-specific recombinase XerD